MTRVCLQPMPVLHPMHCADKPHLHPFPQASLRAGPRPGQAQSPTPEKAQGGETLVGLVVGLGMGLVVLAAGSHMLAQHLRGHQWALQDSHLHHDLRAALDTIATALRQAQSVGHAEIGRSATECKDAFCGGLGSLKIEGQRIDFGHDRNFDGLLDNNECTGFRLRQHELQVRTACTPEVWTDLTDAGSLKMTQLEWQLHCEPRGAWVARWVTVRLHAQWPRDSARELQISHTVALRNHVSASPWPTACRLSP